MSKIYLKTSATPLYVEKRVALEMKRDYLNQAKKPTEIIEIKHALGQETLVFNDLRSFSINADEDYYTKLKENQNTVKNEGFRPYVGNTWLDKEARFDRRLSFSEKLRKTGFAKLVWSLFRDDGFDYSQYRSRAEKFFKENPNRTLCDIDIIVGIKTKTAHNMTELSVINIIFLQIKNDKKYSKVI